jgi:competence protein ComEA
MFKVMLGVLLFTIITMVVFINIDPNLVTESISQSSITDGYLTVQVSGEINSAGTYIVDKDATLQTLIDLAGGTTENADPKTYIATTQVSVSKTYYIGPLHDPSDVCGTTLLTKVDLNHADKNTLMTLSNIGNSLADAIIEYRQEKAFTYLEEIMLVAGIGNATFSRIKNYITLM